ncbi:MAG: hypothetical protein P4L63_03405 [Candidatus Pacebacteria bacterium]|nr:hypothetical protein [Candidatus Paceibacterota bacterium]
MDYKKREWDYLFSGGTSSEGTLNLELYFPNKSTTKNQKENALADALSKARNYMLQNGYLPSDARFMSPKDVAKKYGFTRQYWEKLINEGKIPYRETSAGRITTNLWVQGYLNNKEVVDSYIKNRNKAVDSIKSQKETRGRIECPNCKQPQLDYNRNPNNINALCRAKCGFRIVELYDKK